MSYKLTIEISERDVRHFQREMQRARAAVRIADDEDIIDAATELLQQLQTVQLPDFIVRRVQNLSTLLTMVKDTEWELSARERASILAALAYFCDPEDVIHDNLPGLGLLDDAVMIELVFRDLRHAVDAYEDYCAFRSWLKQRADLSSPRAAARLQRRRQQLKERMHRRRDAEHRAISRQVNTVPFAWW